jgi:SAM-dependent methyltransferase
MTGVNDAIFERMRQSHLTPIVGGGDPRKVADSNLAMLEKLVDLAQVRTVVDFGCGIGRLAAALLNRLAGHQRVIGIDIIPDVIEFCRSEITSHYENSEFICIDATNPHYPRSGGGDTEVVTQQAVIERFRSQVDLVCALSLITHMNEHDIGVFLDHTRQLLRPRGKALVSCYLLDRESRESMHSGRSLIRFGHLPRAYEHYFATRDDLDFVAISYEALETMVSSCGLKVDAVVFGNWRGIEPAGMHDLSFRQDCLLIRKPVERALPGDFDEATYLALNPDVASDGVSAAKHYLLYGVDEGRRYK